MAVQHKDIPEDELHEPKGVSTAANGTVYTANGVGSGSWVLPTTQWTAISNKPSAFEPIPSSVIDIQAAKTEIAALTLIADTANATAEDVAIKLNKVISALKAGS